MLELLQKLFVGHVHKWVEYEKHNCYAGSSREIADNVIYIRQCEHCGKLKKFSVY